MWYVTVYLHNRKIPCANMLQLIQTYIKWTCSMFNLWTDELFTHVYSFIIFNNYSLTTMTHNRCQFMIKWNHCAQIMDLCDSDLHPLRWLGRNYRINNKCQTGNEIPMINRDPPITGKPWHWKCHQHRMNIHCAAGLLLILLKDQSVLFDWNTSPSRYMGNVFTKRQWLIQHHV